MKIMDVTFRESVLCQNQIELKSVYDTINRLAQTHIDYIEIGYLKFGKGANPLENYSPEYISECFEICAGKTKLAAMIHPDDFSSSRYDKDIVKQLSLIRVTCKPANMHKVSEISAFFRSLGVEVSVNLLRASKFSDEQSLEYCGRAKDLGASFFYIADSNGHFLPYQVRSRMSALKQSFPEMQIGFHPHDNLRLAAVNAIEAAQGGADIVDGSLLGYGKGAGNLKTEVFPLVFARMTGKQDVENIYSLFRVAQHFCNNVVSPNTFEEEFKFSLYGLFDIDLDIDKKICAFSKGKGLQDHEVAFELIRQSKGNIAELEEAIGKLEEKSQERVQTAGSQQELWQN
jgi:4-hydroxy 2-oxovalerate aldolase